MVQVSSVGGEGIDRMRWQVPWPRDGRRKYSAVVLAKPDRGVLVLRGDLSSAVSDD
jgi:hypothetical protein